MQVCLQSVISIQLRVTHLRFCYQLKRIFLSFNNSNTAVGPTQPPMRVVPNSSDRNVKQTIIIQAVVTTPSEIAYGHTG